MSNENTEDKTSKNEKNEDTTSKNENGDNTPKNEDDVDLEELPKEELVKKFKEEQKNSKSAIAQKKHFRSKVDKLKDALEDKDDKKEETKKDKKPEISDRLDRIEFLTKNRKLDSEDYHNIESIALGKGISLEKAKEDAMFKSYLKDKREKVAQENKTPSPSSRSPKVNGKDIGDMSDDEIKENWGKLAAEAIKNKRK